MTTPDAAALIASDFTGRCHVCHVPTEHRNGQRVDGNCAHVLGQVYAVEQPGQPGKNGVERAGLAGRDVPTSTPSLPFRVVIEFDTREDFEEFLYEHDARIGRSCSDVMGAYRVVEPDPDAHPQTGAANAEAAGRDVPLLAPLPAAAPLDAQAETRAVAPTPPHEG